MIRIKTIVITLCLCCITCSFAAQSERLIWERVPLTIELSLNQERLVHFPEPIKIIEQRLSPHLEALKVKNSLYLKAKEEINESRIIVQLQPNGEVILLNIKASQNAINSNPIDITLGEANPEQPSTSGHYEYNPIQLTRFAIHALYAPQRVREITDGIYRTPMQTHKTISLFYGASIEARPLASWRGGNSYVTAVALKNVLNKEVTLGYDQLLGQWQTASFYPKARLAPRQQHESTTVFLVSEQPFTTALTHSARFSR